MADAYNRAMGGSLSGLLGMYEDWKAQPRMAAIGGLLMGDTKPAMEMLNSKPWPTQMPTGKSKMPEAQRKALMQEAVNVALDWNNPMAMSGMLGIVSPKVAKALPHNVNIPTDDIFTQAVQNTPGARVAEDGLYMNVMRGQKPEMGLMPSVRGGVFYLPEGAPQMKHYSTGKNGYGGTERITGETLVKNPLFVKGATGGKAPEAAFDSLLGKGSYSSMRDDALKVYGGWNASKQQKYQLAEDFLDKYAPEMSGMGAYIVDNSGQGNQLAYALQEAAVASAARGAGHDAVVGYSKGKQGPFLSELFDVRESSYPDKSGGYSLWDE